jgi:hypothetical protein
MNIRTFSITVKATLKYGSKFGLKKKESRTDEFSAIKTENYKITSSKKYRQKQLNVHGESSKGGMGECVLIAFQHFIAKFF